MRSVAVIGGGAAGMMAAACAAQNGHDVMLFEKNEKLGKKLFITGKGRCNFTNAAAISEFFSAIIRNPKFLYSALYSFDNQAMMQLIEDAGVAVKVERGGRAFPVSDKSSDILQALSGYTRRFGVNVRLNTAVSAIEKTDCGFGVCANGVTEFFDRVILCTGGISYPSTGSTGDGHRFARLLGHSVQPLCGALVPYETVENWPGDLSGLTLKNVKLKVMQGQRKVMDEMGEMLFTHFGVSGPLVLTASSLTARRTDPVLLLIDLKPALTHEMLDARILRDFSANLRKQFVNVLPLLLPKSMCSVIARQAEIDEQKPVDAITKVERSRLVETLKALPLNVKGTRPVEEAIVTCGGITVKEVNPSTMESKLVPGLYFAGEVLDVDALTGGYNLQIAFSTGALAGKSIH